MGLAISLNGTGIHVRSLFEAMGRLFQRRQPCLGAVRSMGNVALRTVLMFLSGGTIDAGCTAVLGGPTGCSISGGRRLHVICITYAQPGGVL